MGGEVYVLGADGFQGCRSREALWWRIAGILVRPAETPLCRFASSGDCLRVLSAWVRARVIRPGSVGEQFH